MLLEPLNVEPRGDLIGFELCITLRDLCFGGNAVSPFQFDAESLPTSS